jgi:hypothetical protein
METTEPLTKNPNAGVELDSTSDRYRICPHPGCKKPHMVSNRGKDYCSNKCADDHYNMLRRLKKQAQRAEAARFLTIREPALFMESEPVPSSVPQAEVAPSMALSGLEKNINILSALDLDSVHGSVFTYDALVGNGFDFGAYSASSKNFNIPEQHFSNYLTYGAYRIYRVTADGFLIKQII